VKPEYEFVCDGCKKRYVVEQGMNDEHKYNCPKCGAAARRVWDVKPFSFEFWYGWDEGMGEYVDNKRQRENFRREKGLLTEHELREIL